MSKISPRVLHGLADHNYIALVSIAPQLAGFEEEEKATLLCRLLSGSTLITSALTRSEWGFVPLIPYKLHLLLDFLSGVLSLSAPYVFGFSQNKRARNTFLLMGVVGLLASLLTQDKEMD